MPKYDVKIVEQNKKGKDLIQNLLKPFSFYLNGCGFQEGYSPENSCDNRVIVDYELIYFLGGSGEIGIEGIKYPEEPGMLFLIPPFTRHYIHSSAEDPHTDYWVHFNIEPFWNARPLIHAITDIRSSYCAKVGLDERLAELFGRLYQEMNHEGPGSSLMSELLFREIMVSLIRKRMERSDDSFFLIGDISHSEEVVKAAMQYVNDHLDQSIPVKELAKAAGVSESYLFKCFSRSIGMTPNIFVQTMKARRAKYLIETTDLTLAEIAVQLGFSTYYYFSAFFKKMYGVSPRLFKQSKGRIDK